MYSVSIIMQIYFYYILHFRNYWDVQVVQVIQLKTEIEANAERSCILNTPLITDNVQKITV
jgi:hypothetical protein